MFEDDVSVRIDEVYHEGVVRVDEVGTEAAAATAVRMVSVSRRHFHVKVDPPFFVIQYQQTGEPLFVGQSTDPTR